MHRRALQLAGFLLLLSTLGMAEGPASRAGGCSLGARYISVLLARHEAAADTRAGFAPAAHGLAAAALTPTSLAQANIAWAVRPPSAHSSATHAVTGSGL
jgi:hypothetical protein